MRRRSACDTCPQQPGPSNDLLTVGDQAITVALAGNPNVGKSSVFNQLTGLRQHVGNWPGKTVQRAEGRFAVDGVAVKLIDLPGTYALQSASVDESIAREYLLFGRPAATIVVVDASALERNLNLLLQVIEITDHVVVALNLIDEARRLGLAVDPAVLSQELGVPVVPTVASRGEGMDQLARTVVEVATGRLPVAPRRVPLRGELLAAAGRLTPAVAAVAPGLDNARWTALRLLEHDETVAAALAAGSLSATLPGQSATPPDPDQLAALLAAAAAERERLGSRVADELVVALYQRAEEIAAACTRRVGPARRWLDETMDRLLCSRLTGGLTMAALLGLVFWLTIAGANVPSQMLSDLLLGFEPVLAGWLDALGAPWWLTGLLAHGVWRSTAWVVSVMLPPMAIFFPLFTLLEDAGYLPRVAFNLDRFFRAAGAHGKQALTMAMGFGCNAAGVTSCRIIDSPRERLIAILTNNFVPCNGRFPTLLMLATVFVAPLAGPGWGSLAGAAVLVGCVGLGIVATLGASWLLSRTVLRGEPSVFVLEMPAYRRPQVLRVLHTSLIDRTLFVLWRAVIFAAPAGLLIWVLGNIDAGGQSLFALAAGWLDPAGRLLGLDGVILLAYLVAIPANEIVVPTIFMGYQVVANGASGTGTTGMFELESLSQISDLLIVQQGWSLVTATCLILFCLLHNPCSTTLYTIYKETGSAKWTLLAALLPLGIGLIVCFTVAQTARLLGLG